MSKEEQQQILIFLSFSFIVLGGPQEPPRPPG